MRDMDVLSFQQGLSMYTRKLQTTTEDAPAAPAALAERASASRVGARFDLEIGTGYHDRLDMQAAWRALLAASNGPEKIYQSPEFFRHLLDMQAGPEGACELFIARRHSDHVIVGVIPVRVIRRELDFRFGPKSLFKRPVRVLQILGSLPLLDPAEEGLHEFVMRQLIARYAHCHAAYMQAVPQEAGASWDGMAGLSTYVLNGWRDCHTQPLPETVDAYLQKFSAKKRYNLSRQVRLLEKEAGALQVLRIERPEQVGMMLDAIETVAPERTSKRQDQQALMENMARHGMLLSYVIRCGEEDVAVVHGVQSNGIWHIYNIVAKQAYMHLSVGTSATHLAMQDVLANFSLTDADFHYGTPNAEFRSTHVMKTRGHVMLFRSRSLASLLLNTHSVVDGFNEGLIRQVKLAKKKIEERKKEAAKARKAREVQTVQAAAPVPAEPPVQAEPPVAAAKPKKAPPQV